MCARWQRISLYYWNLCNFTSLLGHPGNKFCLNKSKTILANEMRVDRLIYKCREIIIMMYDYE